MVGRILRIGLPAALAGFIRNASRLVLLGIVAMSTFPQAAHAAVGLAFQVRMIGILPALAFHLLHIGLEFIAGVRMRKVV